MPTLKELRFFGIMVLLLLITLGPAFIYHQSEIAPVKDEAYAQVNGIEQ